MSRQTSRSLQSTRACYANAISPPESTGFIKDPIQPQDYIFGDAQLQADILQPDSQWDALSVYAWVQGTDGLYIKPEGATDNQLVRPVRLRGWPILEGVDSYSNTYITIALGLWVMVRRHQQGTINVVGTLRK